MPDKQRVRQRALDRRDAIDEERRRRCSAIVRRRFLRLAAVRRAAVLFSFVSVGSEVETTEILRWALRRGLVTCIPQILAPRRMAAVRIFSLDDLQPGIWDIPEPRPGLPEVLPHDIDVAVIPGAAFDEAGYRLGYGGGFYDSFLRDLRADAARIALAFERQLVPHVPTEEHDVPVQTVVTERRILRCPTAC